MQHSTTKVGDCEPEVLVRDIVRDHADGYVPEAGMFDDIVDHLVERGGQTSSTSCWEPESCR